MSFESCRRSAATYAATRPAGADERDETIRASLTINPQCAMQRLFTDRYLPRTGQMAFSMTRLQRIADICRPTRRARHLGTMSAAPSHRATRPMLRRTARDFANSRYPSCVISCCAADGTKSRGPTTVRAARDAGRCGDASRRACRAVVADAQTGGRPSDARRSVRRRDRCARASLARRPAGRPSCRACHRRSTINPASRCALRWRPVS
ncbi:hypothetical protein UA11_03283 [Burkholderia multivorans]|nr:hypothetical protein UA12_03170 [Burkholderia multivorans]SAJ87130.1 hypothetical protein UA11_03283 [Burkholderia multivorans]